MKEGVVYVAVLIGAIAVLLACLWGLAALVRRYPSLYALFLPAGGVIGGVLGAIPPTVANSDKQWLALSLVLCLSVTAAYFTWFTVTLYRNGFFGKRKASEE